MYTKILNLPELKQSCAITLWTSPRLCTARAASDESVRLHAKQYPLRPPGAAAVTPYGSPSAVSDARSRPVSADVAGVDVATADEAAVVEADVGEACV